MKENKSGDVDPVVEVLAETPDDNLLMWKKKHEEQSALMQEAYAKKTRATQQRMKNSKKRRTSIKHRKATSMQEHGGINVDVAYVEAEVNTSDPTPEDSIMPDTYQIRNIDTWGGDYEKGDWYYLQFMHSMGMWLFKQTLAYLNNPRIRKRMNAKKGHETILAYLKKKHRRFEYIDDEWALSTIRYAFVSNGLYAKGAKRRYIDKTDLAKRGRCLVFYNKITTFKIDWIKGIISIPRIDGHGTFDILFEPGERRYHINLLKIERDMVTTHGYNVVIYSDDAQREARVAAARRRPKNVEFKVVTELNQFNTINTTP